MWTGFGCLVIILWFGEVWGTTKPVDPGTHCSDIPDTSGSGTVEACATCFFPQNCKNNNECVLGSEGAMCERCTHYSSSGHTSHRDQGYYRVGNMCYPCSTFPWALIAMSLFFVVAVMVVVFNGLTVSVATKVKHVVDFMQYVMLCVSIKVLWSTNVVRITSVFQFSSFSPSLATPACALSDNIMLYFLEWGGSFGLLLFFLLVLAVLDRRLKANLGSDSRTLAEKKQLWWRRSQYRRLANLVLNIYYVPLSISAIQSFSCTGSLFPESLTLYTGQEVFLYDMRVNCEEATFAAVNSIYTLVLIGYTCSFPLALLFFTLRQKKWNFLQSGMIRYGSVYETYKFGCCFWEAVVMIRKLVYVLLTYTYPISPLYQAIGHVSITGFYFLCIIVFRPYRKFTWNYDKLKLFSPTLVFEVLSTVCVLLLQTQAVLIADNNELSPLDWTCIFLLIITLLFWLVSFLAVQVETSTPDLEEFDIPGEKRPTILEVKEWKDLSDNDDSVTEGR